jgi:hypothetical protein
LLMPMPVSSTATMTLATPSAAFSLQEILSATDPLAGVNLAAFDR